jgi:uncharacterized protein HemY
MSEKTVRDVMLDTVLNQIDNNDPPEARETYDRLIDGGASNTQALRLMAAALHAEMTRMLTESVPFDNAHYAELLKKIPAGDG